MNKSAAASISGSSIRRGQCRCMRLGPRKNPRSERRSVMKLHISKEPSSNPWPVTLAKLASLEHQIQDTNKEGMLKRWEFGHELLKRRVSNPVQKRQQIVPPELMKLTIKECGISQREISYRIKFAERYPTKQDACKALQAYP